MEKNVFAIRHNSKALQLCLWGTPTAGRVLVLFGHQICSLHVLSPFESDFKGSEVSFPNISKRFWHLGRICTLWIALPEGRGLTGSPEVTASSLVMASSLQSAERWILFLHTHTHRESLVCALCSGLANLFPWPQAYHQTWSAKPQELFLRWHLWVNHCRIWLSHLHKQLHLSCWSLFETWFNSSWLYSVWHMRAMWLRCCFSCCSCGCVKVGLSASCVQGIVVPFFSQGSSADQAESWWDAFAASPLSDAVLLSVAWECGRCMLNQQFYWAAFQPRGKLTSNLCSLL